MLDDPVRIVDDSARIVVVDDNPATLYSTAHVLRVAGFDVTEGATGKPALAFATHGADLLDRMGQVAIAARMEALGLVDFLDEGRRDMDVDDDPNTCSVMSRILHDSGAIVATAGDVDAGLIELERFNPQVLVSDIGMPERDGYDLIREVRARPFVPDAARDRPHRLGRPPGSAPGLARRLPGSRRQAHRCE